VAELLKGRPSSRQSGVYAERYAVRGLLGKGAMTQVLLGEDAFTHEPVAIKVLDSSFVSRAEVVERFTRESEALSRVRHPHVVRALAAGVGEDGLPFQVLEHLHGEPLDGLLKRERALHPKMATRILHQLASALEAVHQAGIVHRDIKPANLMLLGDDGTPLAVKLVDFGFAHVNGSSVLTPPGTALGTVAYMAPEQVLGDHIDGRADLYGLGVLAFRMLAGSLPFEGEGVDLMARQLVEAVPALRARAAQVDERLARVVAAATRKVPGLRYPTASALREDLERVMRGGDEALAADELAVDGVYQPGVGLPQQVAKFLYGRLGVTPPSWGEAG